MTAGAVLTLRGFGVAFGDRTVLSDVSLALPHTGLVNLVGPAGAGKSTLLRTLAGLNASHPGLSIWGEAMLDGSPISRNPSVLPGDVRRGIGFVVQHARFFVDDVRENLVSALANRSLLDRATQTRLVQELLRHNGLSELANRLGEDVSRLSTSLQRRLSIVRALASDPLVLFVDEPTAGLPDDDAVEVLSLLRVQAHFRAVVHVTHNQRWARAAGGMTALLADGRIQELTPTREFFDSPRTAEGGSFVRTGRCRESLHDGPSDDPADGMPPSGVFPPPRVRSRFDGPRGFFWLRPGRLGGLPRPGIVDSVERDLDGLVRLGVTVLVTLEETSTVEPALVEARGIALVHFPIVDMGAPDVEAAEALCGELAQVALQGGVVAMHCRAGLGRTGTLLAAQLIYDGEPARVAIERVRRLNPRCIQSAAQIEFLSSYEEHLRRRNAAAGVRGLSVNPNEKETRTEWH